MEEKLYLKKINDKWHICVYDLVKLGFGFPPAGTKGHTILGIFGDRDSYYKFHAPAPDYGGIWISPFLSDVGKRVVSQGDFWVEFSLENFTYKTKD